MSLDKDREGVTIDLKSLMSGALIVILAVGMGLTGVYLARKYDPPPEQVPNELKIVIEEQLLRERAELIRALIEKIDLKDCDTLVVHSVSKFLPEVDITCTKKRKRK